MVQYGVFICILNLQDNEYFDLTMDSEVMSWSIHQPDDWKVGRRGETYMWGSGRHGEITEGCRMAVKPVKVMSLGNCQTVGVFFPSIVVSSCCPSVYLCFWCF